MFLHWRSTIVLVLLLIVAMNGQVFAQLANSPWPMYAHDAQHTLKSEYAGTPNAFVKWQLSIGSGLTSYNPAIAPDGTVYVGSDDSKVYAISMDGNLKWLYATGGKVTSSPAIGSDGTVYVGSHDDKLYAFGPGPGG